MARFVPVPGYSAPHQHDQHPRWRIRGGGATCQRNWNSGSAGKDMEIPVQCPLRSLATFRPSTRIRVVRTNAACPLRAPAFWAASSERSALSNSIPSGFADRRDRKFGTKCGFRSVSSDERDASIRLSCCNSDRSLFAVSACLCSKE